MVQFRPPKCEDLFEPSPFLTIQVQISATKMGDELTRLIEIFHKIEEAGGQATLTVTTQGGKTKTTFETESPPSATEPASSPPASRRRRRRCRRGAAAKSRLDDQQAAAPKKTLPLFSSRPHSCGLVLPRNDAGTRK